MYWSIDGSLSIELTDSQTQLSIYAHTHETLSTGTQATHHWILHSLAAHLCFGTLQGLLTLSQVCPEPTDASLLPGDFAFNCDALVFFLVEAPCHSLLGKSETAQLVPLVFFLCLPPAGYAVLLLNK